MGDFEMSSLDYWRFCEELTVQQAALLIVGEDPSSSLDYNYVPVGYKAVMAALVSDVKGKRLSANVPEGGDQFGDHGVPLWDDATIMVEDLRAWLKKRGVETGFFFPRPAGPAYLSPVHPHYSPKLAAAICAWNAVSQNAELRRAKTVKKALDVWLRQHANEFGLTKDDGNPNEQGIEEVAKIANWDTRGGAPKTPTVA
jgi:hypothetical protein